MSNIIVLRRISRVVEQSFPNNKLVEKGLLLPTECDELERIDEETPNENDDASWLLTSPVGYEAHIQSQGREMG